MTSQSFWLTAGAWCVFAGSAQACAGTEPPPCDPATLAQITATCPNAEECNRLLDEREATCAKRIKEDK
jgi:hypothetical protein